MEEKEERYFIVERKINYNREVAFIRTLGNKLEHIAGENLITRIMEFDGKDLKPRKIATSKYAVVEVEKNVFGLHKDQYLDTLKKYKKCVGELAGRN